MNYHHRLILLGRRNVLRKGKYINSMYIQCFQIKLPLDKFRGSKKQQCRSSGGNENKRAFIVNVILKEQKNVASIK